jgi:hypothetical protein
MSRVMDSVVDSLKKRLTGADVRMEEPLSRTGLWHVDIRRGDHAVVLQWSPQKGFGVSADLSPGLGEGPHEVYRDSQEAMDRAVHLIETGERTRPPQEALLSSLRTLLGVSQEELAARLKMRQANVSRLERQSDMRISTLRKLVGAIGADLDIVARVGEAHVKLTQFEEPKAGKPASRRGPRRASR